MTAPAYRIRPGSGAGSTSIVRPAASPAGRLHQLFQREAPGQLSALRAAVVRDDRREVARLAHYLQGSAYALGDESLRAACADLRRWAEGPPGADGVTPKVHAVEDAVRNQLGKSA